MATKYYTPEIEEFHVGFEYENKLIDNNWKWNGDTDKVVFTSKTNIQSIIDYPHLVRVKHLDREDVESLLNEIDLNTGKKWSRGRNCVKGDAPYQYPWIEFILEDASLIIINEYRKQVLIEKTFPNGRGRAVIFNGTIKNKSELKRILKQLGICHK